MTWNIASAKQQFSEVVRLTAEEPQAIYNRDKPVAVIISAQDFEDFQRWRAERDRPSLAQQFDEIRALLAAEALMLCLRAVTKPGDVVAVETPTYFGILHVLEALSLRALEIPTDSQHGLRLDVFERVLKTQPVHACIALPACSNPLGAAMPDDTKQRLVALLKLT